MSEFLPRKSVNRAIHPQCGNWDRGIDLNLNLMDEKERAMQIPQQNSHISYPNI